MRASCDCATCLERWRTIAKYSLADHLVWTRLHHALSFRSVKVWLLNLRSFGDAVNDLDVRAGLSASRDIRLRRRCPRILCVSGSDHDIVLIAVFPYEFNRKLQHIRF